MKNLSFGVKVISHNENSDQTQTCRVESSNGYDKCMYTSTNKLIEKTFNCSFGIIYNNAEKSGRTKECKIGEEGNLWSAEALREIMENGMQDQVHK